MVVIIDTMTEEREDAPGSKKIENRQTIAIWCYQSSSLLYFKNDRR